MGVGFQVTNSSGRLQIDQDSSVARLVASGSATTVGNGGVSIDMPYDITTEPPIVLVRPHLSERYIGGTMLRPPGDYGDPFGVWPRGFVSIKSQCDFDWMIFSTAGTAVSDGASHGVEVYRSDGSTVAYSSRHRHPAITSLLYKPPDTTLFGGWPNAFTISGFSQMPWLLANPLLSTFFGVGEFSESIGAVMAKVSADFSTVTVDMRDGGYDYAGTGGPADWYPHFPTLSDTPAYNPYSGVPAWFAVARIA